MRTTRAANERFDSIQDPPGESDALKIIQDQSGLFNPRAHQVALVNASENCSRLDDLTRSSLTRCILLEVSYRTLICSPETGLWTNCLEFPSSGSRHLSLELEGQVSPRLPLGMRSRASAIGQNRILIYLLVLGVPLSISVLVRAPKLDQLNILLIPDIVF